jgi:hypothetical protein
MGWSQACTFIILLALVFLLIFLLCVWNNICGSYATMFYLCYVEQYLCYVELFVLLYSICEIPVCGMAMEFSFTALSFSEFHYDRVYYHEWYDPSKL